jgi:CDGSH-type Zn-finger protein
MADITIEVRDNGPYIIRGGATLADAEGNQFEAKEMLVLCRCGQSAKKPFCDATHRGCGFESAPRAGA